MLWNAYRTVDLRSEIYKPGKINVKPYLIQHRIELATVIGHYLLSVSLQTLHLYSAAKTLLLVQFSFVNGSTTLNRCLILCTHPSTPNTRLDRPPVPFFKVFSMTRPSIESSVAVTLARPLHVSNIGQSKEKEDHASDTYKWLPCTWKQELSLAGSVRLTGINIRWREFA